MEQPEKEMEPDRQMQTELPVDLQKATPTGAPAALAGEAVVLWTSDARGARASRAAPPLPGDDDGFAWLEDLHPEDRTRVRKTLFAASAGQQPYRVEYRVRRPGGGYAWMLDAGQPQHDAAGGFLGHAGATVDISERVQAEATLRATNRRKDEFLATLAHELRNPLAPMRNALELLGLLQADPEAIEDVRSMMDRQVRQLVRLVDDLLDVHRITRNKLELRRRRVNLTTVLQSAIETSRTQIEAAGQTLTVEFAAHPVQVEADASRLAQIFANLLNNATKFTPEGGNIQLNVRHVAGEDEVAVSIRDDGRGIPSTLLPQIFDMFMQEGSFDGDAGGGSGDGSGDGSVSRPSSGKSEGGLGIGLTLARRLSQLHGGRIEAHSDGPGTGSEFVVHLPACTESARSDRRRERRTGARSRRLHELPAAARPSGERIRRILVVDDNRDAATSLELLLELQGYAVDTAYDAPSAIERARLCPPDLVLLDIGLPGMNGYEACRAMRSEVWAGQTVFVALTGWGQPEDFLASHEAGFAHHLIKPVDPGVFQDLLAQLLPD